jgi:hypothetical protein
MRTNNTTKHQLPAAEPETALERITKLCTSAAVQIIQAINETPTRWTVIQRIVDWVLEQAKTS